MSLRPLNPNDMAMIVRDTLGNNRSCFAHLIGTPLTVSHSVGEFQGSKVWTYKGATLRCPNCRVPFDVLIEADLQRMRGPAIGAAGSTTTEKTVPAPTKRAEPVAA